MINIRIKFRIYRAHEEEEKDDEEEIDGGCSKDRKPFLTSFYYIHIIID